MTSNENRFVPRLRGASIASFALLMVAAIPPAYSAEPANPHRDPNEPAAADSRTTAPATSTAEPSTEAAKSDLMSLIDAMPAILGKLNGYPERYTRPRTAVDAPWYERDALFDGQWRRDLEDAGVYADLHLTQVYQGNAHGGLEDGSDSFRYSGSYDLFVNLDTAKLGWWSGGLIHTKLETFFGRSISDKSGTLIPVNHDSTMPDATTDDRTTLSELYLLQALDKNWTVWFGKIDLTAIADVNEFANSEQTQFLNSSLRNDPVTGLYAPYTALSAIASYTTDDGRFSHAVAIADNQASATKTGFHTAFSTPSGMTAAYNLDYADKIDGRPFNAHLLLAWTNKDSLAYGQNRFAFIDSALTGTAPDLKFEDDNRGIFLSMDHYFHVEDIARKRGWGAFLRLGYSDSDASITDKFLSFGLGGKGLLDNRPDDGWGAGFAMTHITEDLADIFQGRTINSPREKVVELFYNIEITPAIHLTPDIQAIFDPAGFSFAEYDDRDVEYVVGFRLQIDF